MDKTQNTLITQELFQIVERYREEKAIYSSFADNRTNLCDVDDPHILQKARSVACLIFSPDHIEEDDGGETYTLKGQSLAERVLSIEGRPGHPGENVHFASEPSLGEGTAFLVGPDLALTAGHCVCKENLNKLDRAKIAKTMLVFGFQMKANEEWDKKVTRKNVRHIREVIQFRNKGKDGDWALLRLSQKVHHISPLKVDFTNIIVGKPNIYMLGHPSGLPLKFVEKGKVEIVPNTGKERFQAAITAYKGNSGSPIFDANSHEVIGILVAGNKDFSGSSGSASDHVVTPEEIEARGYEKCQRTSALPDEVVGAISPLEVEKRKQADELHDKGINEVNSNEIAEAFRDFIQSGDLGLHQSYLNAITLRGGRVSSEEAAEYSEKFFTYLKTAEAAAAGVELGKRAELYVTAESGGKVSAQESHFGDDAVIILNAQDSGRVEGRAIRADENTTTNVYAGKHGRSNADRMILREGASATILANADPETVQDAKSRAKEALKRAYARRSSNE